MSSLFEEPAKDMHKLFALGRMCQSDVNGIKQFQLQTIKL